MGHDSRGHSESFWTHKSEAECEAEVLRRSRTYSQFRADRLRLPVSAAATLERGDRIQCFHDERTGFHDWVRYNPNGNVEVLAWRERENRTIPPTLRTLGAVLDEYKELRINNATQRASKPAEKYAADSLFSFLYDDDDDDTSWLDKPNEACFYELAARCKEFASWKLFRFRVPTGISRPTPGCTLQLFHDRCTGFATFGRLLFDDTSRTHFVRIYSDHTSASAQQQQHQHRWASRDNSDDVVPLPFVDIPLGIVLDQYAELRVYTEAPRHPSLDAADDVSW